MKTILAILAIALTVFALLWNVLSWLGKHSVSEDEGLFHDAYADVFGLIGYLKQNKPEKYQEVAEYLNNIVDDLLIVEQKLQETNDN